MQFCANTKRRKKAYFTLSQLTGKTQANKSQVRISDSTYF